MSKEPFNVGYRLIAIIKSFASSSATRWTKVEGWLGLGASDSRQKRYNMCIAQIKSAVLSTCMRHYIYYRVTF